MNFTHAQDNYKCWSLCLLPHEILSTQLNCASLQGLLLSPMGSGENASVHFLLILCSLMYLTAPCSPPDAEKLDCLQRRLRFRMNCCYLIISLSPLSAVLFLSGAQPQQPPPPLPQKGYSLPNNFFCPALKELHFLVLRLVYPVQTLKLCSNFFLRKLVVSDYIGKCVICALVFCNVRAFASFNKR